MVPLQFVQTPKIVVILYESNFIGQTYRIIYTDGRPHPKDLDSSFLAIRLATGKETPWLSTSPV